MKSIASQKQVNSRSIALLAGSTELSAHYSEAPRWAKWAKTNVDPLLTQFYVIIRNIWST